MPSHREVASVNYLLYAMASWDYPTMSVNTLRAIVTTDGPTGDATAVILGIFLSSVPTDRVIPLMLSLAARDALPGRGARQAPGHAAPAAVPGGRPAVRGPGRTRPRGRAPPDVEILRSLLPELIPREGERIPAPLSEAVVFATDVAAWVGASDEILAITAYAREQEQEPLRPGVPPPARPARLRHAADGCPARPGREVPGR